MTPGIDEPSSNSEESFIPSTSDNNFLQTFAAARYTYVPLRELEAGNSVYMGIGYSKTEAEIKPTEEALAAAKGQYRVEIIHLAQRFQEDREAELRDLAGRMDRVKEQQRKHDREEEKLWKEKEEWKDKRKKAVDELEQAEKALVDAKVNIISNWIEQAKEIILKILQVDKELQQKRQEFITEHLTSTKESRLGLIKEVKEIITMLRLQSDIAKGKLSGLQSDGISRKTSTFLIGLGYATAVTAGWIFSIFTMNAGFSSSDIFFFLYKGITHMSLGEQGSPFSVICQWILVLMTMTGALLIWRAVAVHIKRKSKADKHAEDPEEHLLEMEIKSERFKYSSKFKSGNWSLFYISAMPILLIAGVLVILLSYDMHIKGSLEDLEKSLPGLVVGTGIALGLGALAFLYVARVSMHRWATNPTKVKRWFGSWELTAVALLFFAATGAAIFYVMQHGAEMHEAIANRQAPLEHELKPQYKMILSLLLFLPASLLAAVSLGFGLHYQSVQDLNDDLDYRIRYFIDLAGRLDSPISIGPNKRLNMQADALLQGLLKQVGDKNFRLFNDDLRVVQARRITEEEADAGEEYKTRLVESQVEKKRSWTDILAEIVLLFLKMLDKVWVYLCKLINDLILPDENQKENSAPGYSILQVAIPWEEQFFPDLTERLKVARRALLRIDKELDRLQKSILEWTDKKKIPLSSILEDFQKVKEEITERKRQIENLRLATRMAIGNMETRYQRALIEFRKGVELRQIYQESGFKTIFTNRAEKN